MSAEADMAIENLNINDISLTGSYFIARLFIHQNYCTNKLIMAIYAKFSIAAETGAFFYHFFNSTLPLVYFLCKMKLLFS